MLMVASFNPRNTKQGNKLHGSSKQEKFCFVECKHNELKSPPSRRQNSMFFSVIFLPRNIFVQLWGVAQGSVQDPLLIAQAVFLIK